MAKNNEAVDREALSIDQAIWELVNRVYPSLMDTYEKLKAVDPILAEKYRTQKETHDAVMEIKRMTLEERQQQAEREGWVKRGVVMIVKGLGWVK